MSSIIKGISAIGTAFNVYSILKKVMGGNEFAGEYTKTLKEDDSSYQSAWGRPTPDWMKQIEAKGKEVTFSDEGQIGVANKEEQ